MTKVFLEQPLASPGSANHTLSIWLEMEFAKDILVKNIFNNKLNKLFDNQIKQEILFKKHFFLVLGALDFFLTFKNLVFGFTSSKSHV